MSVLANLWAALHEALSVNTLYDEVLQPQVDLGGCLLSNMVLACLK